MLKFARRLKSTSQLVKNSAELPANATKVASQKTAYYDIQEFQNSSLKEYFEQDALLFPVETIIEKTNLKDYEFFLGQTNFLKVVDTLDKFEQNILDRESPKARDFVLFKRQLYAMYEVQNRTVGEHELFSFEVERQNLRWLYNANSDFVTEMRRVDTLDQLADFSRLGPNEVFKRRTLNPRRLKGVGSFVSAYGLYAYAPYLAVYLGQTVPVLGAVAAGLYGMLSFSESQIVNKITLIKDGSEHHGRLNINVGLSAFSSTEITVDVKDIQSICSLGNDDLGEENRDGNVLRIARYFDKVSNRWIDDERALTLPGDAFRDRVFMDWILADKSGEGALADDFQDLMLRQNELATKSGKIGAFDVLAARDEISLLADADSVVEAQIKSEDPAIENILSRLQGIYGSEHLKQLTDRELYILYKRHAVSGAK